MGTRNKSAGNAWELECKRALLQWFPNLVTARSESRNRDNKKVDLMNEDEHINGKCDYNFQCKNVSSTVNYRKILEVMPDNDGINVILHKQTKKAGKNFMPVGNYAIMEAKDFRSFVKSEELKTDLYSYILKTTAKGVNYHKLISSFPNSNSTPVVLHRYVVKEGKSILQTLGKYAVIELSSFYKLLNLIIKLKKNKS